MPFIPLVTDEIEKLLKRQNIEPIYKPRQQLGEVLRSAKDKIYPLSKAAVYRISCDCEKVHIESTKRSIGARFQQQCWQLNQNEKVHTLPTCPHQRIYHLFLKNRNHLRHLELLLIESHQNLQIFE